MVGGILGDTKGMNIPGADLTIPALAEKDITDIKWGIAHEMDYVAVSFVKNRKDILDVRKLIEEENGHMNIIAKIETRQAVENIMEILEVVDGIMIARGDLGVEIPTEDVPLVQKELIDSARRKGRSVIVATQMLDSMIRNPRPTRAEASDVANAVLDGTDAVMLSGETAKGAYPVEAVKVMNRIVERAEEILILPVPGDTSSAIQSSIPDAVSNAAVSVAKLMNVGAILSLTRSGSTAKMVSKYRPPCKIIGSTPSKAIYRELSLYWGVVPIMEKQSDNENEAIDYSILSSLNKGYVNEGDLLVVTAGIPMGIPGSTNMMHLLTAGQIILRGLPYLQKEAYGKVCIAETAEEAMKKMNRGDILVVRGTDRNFVPAVEIAGGIITEQTGLTSHPAILALELGIPCILGAQNAMSILEDGAMVTLDGGRGMVYQGQVRLHA
jgi:pyruvate kinase